jgi:hypothetical protein
MSNSQNNATVVDVCTKRLNALKSYVDGKAQINVDGKKQKASQVVAIYQSCLDSRAALATKRAETKAAMATRTSAEQARRSADRAVKAWVVNEFGEGSQQAIDFGFPPPKKATRTVESKVNAVALGKATRAARHTMGKKQKSLIKGTMVAPTAPAVPANVPAGASPASQPAMPATPVAAPQPQMQVVTSAPAPAAPASATQPATPATPVAAPQPQMQTVNGAPAPAAPAFANGAAGH